MNQMIWRDIPGFEGRYQASRCGKIKSVGRVLRFVSESGKECFRKSADRILKTDKKVNGAGYKTCYLGEGKPFFVHVAVCLAFHGPKPHEKAVVNHLDFNRKNNAAWNLEWTTHKQNMRHSMAAGRYTASFTNAGKRWSGHLNPKSKLTDRQTKFIIKSRGKIRQTDLANKFGITQSAVSYIQLNHKESKAALSRR